MRTFVNSKRDMIIIVLVVLATTLPFVNRAFFIDDYYHVTMAKGIIENPLRPYDFRSDDNIENVKSWERGNLPRMVNPPLMHYYLAAIISLFGSALWKLRLSYLLFACVAAIAMYLMAGRFTRYPLAAALLFTCSPAFVLSSYTLMLDMMMIALFLAGFECFMRGCENDSWTYLICAGILLALSPMVKYTGYYTYLFVGAWFFLNYLKDFRKYRYLVIFAIPFLITAGWYWWNVAAYGQSHLLASVKRFVPGSNIFKLIVSLVFLSGVSLFTFVYEALLIKKHILVLCVSFLVGAGLTVFLCSPFGGFNITQAALLSAMLLNSLTVCWLLLNQARRNNTFLLFWFFTGAILVILPIPWVAGRYYLLVMPALSILTIEMVAQNFERYRMPLIWLTVGVTGIGTIALASADYMQAGVYKAIARDVETSDAVQNAPGKKIVLGDTFFGYSCYLKDNGWRVIFDSSQVSRGDLLLASMQSIPRISRPRWDLKLKEIAHFTYRTRYPFRIMDLYSSAGFYASSGGALPFSVSTGPLDTFVLYLVI